MPAGERGTRGSPTRLGQRGMGGRRRCVAAAAMFAAMAIAGAPPDAQSAEEVWIRVQLAQASGASQPRIAVLSTVVAQPASQMPLQINVAPTEAIPRNSFLRLKGLPPTASLSEGHSIAPGSWAVPLNGLPRLTLNLPASATGQSELLISLVGEDGTLLAEARVSLVIQTALQPPAVEKETKTA